MPDRDVRIKRVVAVGLGIALGVVASVVIVLALLRLWGVPWVIDPGPGPDQLGIPPPQLQIAPQLGRAASSPVAFSQRLDEPLPLALSFLDASGATVKLADHFDGEHPVLIVLGYWSCPKLCGLLMHGLLEALAQTGLPADAARIVGVSIDPDDTPAAAQAREAVDVSYARFVADGGATPPLALLVGADGAYLARRVGFGYARTRDDATPFAHPAGVIVATPDGRESRVLMGVRFDPGELRRALVEAADGRIGTPTDRIALLCAHLDPRNWRSAAAMDVVRGFVLVSLAGFAFLVWRRGARR